MTIICVMCSNTAVIYTDCYSSSFNESQPRLQGSPAKEAWDEDEKKTDHRKEIKCQKVGPSQRRPNGAAGLARRNCERM